ncbi:MAG TPA: phosphoglycerate mutase family protein [Steroidobacteraceae bacterium]|nr:phosphoglycerate mutase family protein [Steroidobacteraceae bacterium]
MQQLLIIRHAIAHERDSKRWKNDDHRPLTAKGKTKFRAIARKMRRFTGTPDLLLTSELKRAVQTARILSKEAGYPEARQLKEARPEIATRRLIASLSTLREPYVALVGHEPSLSALASTLLTQSSRAVHIELKKGGIVLLMFPRRIKAGKARLLAFCPPSCFLDR